MNPQLTTDAKSVPADIRRAAIARATEAFKFMLRRGITGNQLRFSETDGWLWHDANELVIALNSNGAAFLVMTSDDYYAPMTNEECDELGIPYTATSAPIGDNTDLTPSEREAIARLENTVIVSPPAKRSASPNRPANVDAAMEANSRAFPYYANRASIEILVIDRDERVHAAPTALLRQDYGIEEHVQEALESVGMQSADDWSEIRMKWINPKSESGK